MNGLYPFSVEYSDKHTGEQIKSDPVLLAKKLGLFKNREGTELRHLEEEGVALLKIHLTPERAMSLRSPIETTVKREYGWVPTGRTSGGAREWLINSDIIQRGVLKKEEFIIEELFRK